MYACRELPLNGSRARQKWLMNWVKKSWGSHLPLQSVIPTSGMPPERRGLTFVNTEMREPDSRDLRIVRRAGRRGACLNRRILNEQVGENDHLPVQRRNECVANSKNKNHGNVVVNSDERTVRRKNGNNGVTNTQGHRANSQRRVGNPVLMNGKVTD